MGTWIEATQASSAPLRVAKTLSVSRKPAPRRMRSLEQSVNVVRTMPQHRLQPWNGWISVWSLYCSLPAVTALTNDSEDV